MRVRFKFFRSGLSTWKSLFHDAAEFASQLPPERVISISHSADGGIGVVTVWYWGEKSASDTPEDEDADSP